MINNVTLMGRLCYVPEVKSGKDKTSYLNNVVAVERNFTNKDGERDSDFINVSAFGGTAEFIEKYFQKGSMIGITGSISTYLTEDGDKITSVTIRDVSFTGERSDKNTTGKNKKKR